MSIFPSLKRRGGCGVNKKSRSHRSAADGVVRPAKSLGLKNFAELTTPSARSKVASRYFLDRASTPPFQGGEYVNAISRTLTRLRLGPAKHVRFDDFQNLTHLHQVSNL